MALRAADSPPPLSPVLFAAALGSGCSPPVRFLPIYSSFPLGIQRCVAGCGSAVQRGTPYHGGDPSPTRGAAFNLEGRPPSSATLARPPNGWRTYQLAVIPRAGACTPRSSRRRSAWPGRAEASASTGLGDALQARPPPSPASLPPPTAGACGSAQLGSEESKLPSSCLQGAHCSCRSA
jgi:hypothetical protein